MAYDDEGFSDFLERPLQLSEDVTMDMQGGIALLDASGGTPIIDSVSAGGVLPTQSIPFDATSMAMLFTNQDMQTSNFVSGSAGWQIKGDGSVEFNNGTFRGALVAATIDIGGADATSFHVDIDGNMWLGAATFNISTNPFAVSNAGVIRAVSGTIAGWTLSSTAFTNTSGGNTVILSTGATAFTSGPTGAPTFTVTTAGAITATSGTIGGWTLSATTIRTGITDANSNVLIDSTNSLLRLGPTTGSTITIDGANQRIRSSTYSAGVSGFNIDTTLIEAQNIIARGTLSGSVFRYDVISATGGRQVIANADALSTAMTALDASTLTIRGNVTFAVNDILVIRAQSSGGILEEYLRVTNIASAPTYTVTRDLLNTFGADLNPAWAAGTAVVQQGESDGAAAFSGGWLDLVGEATSGNWPRISVFNRTGVGATAFTERVRMGNLNGYLGYASDLYGFAVGSSVAGEANITFDSTNGIRIRQGTTNLITFDMAGTATLLNLTVGGSLNVLTSGNFRSGQTAYNTGTGWFLEYNGGTPRLSLGVGGSTTSNLTWDGTTLTVNGRTFSADPIFGDGNDGAVIIAVNTTLTSDMFYTTLVVNAGIILNTGGYRIAARTSITCNGTIARNGSTGTVGNGNLGSNGQDGNAGAAGGAGGTAGGNGTALAAGSTGSPPAGGGAGGVGGVGGDGTSINGVAGSAGTAAGAGVSITSAIGSSGAVGVAGQVGGLGGNGVGGNTGGAGGTAGATAAAGVATAPVAGVRTYANASLAYDTAASVLYRPSASNSSSSGSGGGGGGGGRTPAVARNGGGGGGGGGVGGNGGNAGIVWLASPNITVAIGGAIQANGSIGGIGGTGGNGGNGDTEAGGGGGGSGGRGGSGGCGGATILIYQTLTNNGTIQAVGSIGGAGGVAGTGGTGVGGGTNGANGSAGGTGATGATGIIYQFQRI